jgi:hypothetical protein
MILSPHLDDAVLSCGGLIADTHRHGVDSLVITVFNGRPTLPVSSPAKRFHARCGLADDHAMAQRECEDDEALDIVGASTRRLDLLEALYRKGSDGEPRYDTDQAIFQRRRSPYRRKWRPWRSESRLRSPWPIPIWSLRPWVSVATSTTCLYRRQPDSSTAMCSIMKTCPMCSTSAASAGGSTSPCIDPSCMYVLGTVGPPRSTPLTATPLNRQCCGTALAPGGET